MRILLRLIYPCQGLLPENVPIKQLHLLLKTSQKYFLDSITPRLIAQMESWLQYRDTERPLYVYVNACSLGLEDLAQKATALHLNRSMRASYDIGEFLEAVIQDFFGLGSWDSALEGGEEVPSSHSLSFLGKIPQLLAQEYGDFRAEFAAGVHPFLRHVLHRRGGG